MMMGQMAVHLTQLVDAAMIGRVGVDELAAAAFAVNFYMLFFMVGFGLSIAVSIFTARAYGAGDSAGQRATLGAGINATFWLGVLLAVALHALLPVAEYFGQEPAVLGHARSYIILLGWSSAPVLMMAALKSYGEAIDRPWIPLIWTLAVVPVNVFLNWIFIFGNLGAPAMGLDGAGLATLLARIICFVLMWIGYEKAGLLERNWSLRELILPQWRAVKDIVKTGIGTGIQISFEVASFNVAAIMMGWIGAVSLAAHNIAISLVGLAFMIPLGLSFAISIRIGQALGAHQNQRASRIAWANVLFVIIIMACPATVLAAFRHQLPWIFLDRGLAETAQVAALAATFLLIAAFFQLGDGCNIILMGILRGYNDIRVPTILSFFIFWCFAIPLCFFLTFGTSLDLSRVPDFLQPLAHIGFALEGAGMWAALSAGLWVSAIIMASRTRGVIRRSLVDEER